MLPIKFQFIWPSDFREDLKKSANQTQELPVAATFVKDLGKMCNLQGGLSIDASYQATFHLTKQFQRRRYFRNQPIRNKNCLWRPCLLTDRENISQI
jgi:hypothetical protein